MNVMYFHKLHVLVAQNQPLLFIITQKVAKNASLDSLLPGTSCQKYTVAVERPVKGSVQNHCINGVFWTGPRRLFRDFRLAALGLFQIGGKSHKSQTSQAHQVRDLFSKDFALPAKRGKTSSHLALSESFENDVSWLVGVEAGRILST